MEEVPRFELGIKDLQSSALPLGYTSGVWQEMERKTGFEPATPTLARLCSTPELLPRLMAGLKRLELSTSGVTGRRSNRLSYNPEQLWWAIQGSNL